MKEKSKDTALKACNAFLSLPITLLPVTSDLLWKTQEILRDTPLDSRDAIHIASCNLNSINTFYSEDKDFATIKEY